MTTFNVERFDALIQANREAVVADFNMQRYAHSCGTPACAYGNWAARTDLQPIVKLWTRWSGYAPSPVFTDEMCRVLKDELAMAVHTHPRIADWFGLTAAEVEELFDGGEERVFEVEDDEGDMVEEVETVDGSWGCGGARTPAEAVAYMEAFKARKLAEQG